jgi:thioredoxin reductase
VHGALLFNHEFVNNQQPGAFMTRSSEVVIIGAGPYGLSIAAHLRARGIEFRIFGSPMHTWRAHMPAGMLLKSEAFASLLYDPDGRFTLKRFCRENGYAYRDTGFPVPLETFTKYGLAFQQQLVPDVEDKKVVSLEQSPDNGFLLRLHDGEMVAARRVVIAVGTRYFAHMPSGLSHLPPGTFSHSSDHHDVRRFNGQDVSVIGGGASALDLLVALHDAGAKVRLITRRSSLKFNPPPRHWTWWKQSHPASGLGDGWRNQFYEHAPMLFRRLPREVRFWIVRTTHSPGGGFPVKDRVERLPLLLGHTLSCAEYRDAHVHLRLFCPDGEERELSTDHVIAAAGYRVDLRRLPFLSKELRPQLRAVNFTPVLSAEFQSSVPGLYFAGLATANTFGPVMRFLQGARFTARRLMKHFEKLSAARQKYAPRGLPTAVGAESQSLTGT